MAAPGKCCSNCDDADCGTVAAEVWINDEKIDTSSSDIWASCDCEGSESDGHCQEAEDRRKAVDDVFQANKPS